MRGNESAVTPMQNPADPKEIKSFLELGDKARRRRLAYNAKNLGPLALYQLLVQWQAATKKGRWAKKHRETVAGDLTWLTECWNLRSELETSLLEELELAEQEYTPIHAVPVDVVQPRRRGRGGRMGMAREVEAAEEEDVRRNPLTSDYVRDEILSLKPAQRHKYYARIASRDPATSPDAVLKMVMEWGRRAAEEQWDDEYAQSLAQDLEWLSECFGFEIVQRGLRYPEFKGTPVWRDNPTTATAKAQRVSLQVATAIAGDFRDAMHDAGALRNNRRFVLAGSIRRRASQVGDIDVLLVDLPDAQWAMLEHVDDFKLIEYGPKRARGTFRSHGKRVQLDIRRVGQSHLGAALEYFTGPKGHNLGMRSKAKKKGMKLNEYGLWKGTKLIAAATEKDIYDALGHPWKPPHARGKK